MIESARLDFAVDGGVATCGGRFRRKVTAVGEHGRHSRFSPPPDFRFFLSASSTR